MVGNKLGPTDGTSECSRVGALLGELLGVNDGM